MLQRVSVIEEDFQFVVRIQKTMPEQEKVPKRTVANKKKNSRNP